MSDDTLQQNEDATPDLTQLQKERDEYLAGWKRALADFSNREKELAEEKRAMAAYASRDVILEMLPVLDNLKTALTHLPADQIESEWVKGVGYVVKQFEGVLNNYGVRTFVSVGQTFDPARHEAVGEEKGDGEPGTILKEVAAGYMQNDAVIRPAKVIVKK